VVVVTSIVGLIPFIFQKLGEGIIELAKVIGENTPVLVDAIVAVALAMVEALTAIIPPTVEAFYKLITAILETAAKYIPKMVDAGMKLILGFLKGVADNIADVVAEGIEVILQFMAGVVSKLPDIIDAAFKIIIGFINGLADAIRDNHNAIYDACANLIDSIVDAIVDLIPRLISVGENIVGGLIDGVRNMAGALWNAAKSVVSDAVDGVKDFLGIHSPSTVFAEIGRYSMMGFAGGLKKFGGLVVDAATNVGVTAIDSLNSSISGLYDAVGENIDMNPTIRPVLDLSDVASGANTINSLLNKNRGLSVETASTRLAANVGSMRRDVNNSQNGSTTAGVNSKPGVPDAPKSPTVIQLVLQNGKAIAEFIVDDLDGMMGNTSKINGRAVGLR
jgi:hypothetical protein